MKRVFHKMRCGICYAWAWLWQLCETCKHIDDPDGKQCADCQICMGGKPRWVYRGEKKKKKRG